MWWKVQKSHIEQTIEDQTLTELLTGNLECVLVGAQHPSMRTANHTHSREWETCRSAIQDKHCGDLVSRVSKNSSD